MPEVLNRPENAIFEVYFGYVSMRPACMPEAWKKHGHFSSNFFLFFFINLTWLAYTTLVREAFKMKIKKNNRTITTTFFIFIFTCPSPDFELQLTIHFCVRVCDVTNAATGYMYFEMTDALLFLLTCTCCMYAVRMGCMLFVLDDVNILDRKRRFVKNINPLKSVVLKRCYWKKYVRHYSCVQYIF